MKLDQFDERIVVGRKAQCPECLRVFDLADPDDAEEFFYGHDCEA